MDRNGRRARPATRRLIQLYSALLYNAHLKGFIDGEIYRGPAKLVCAPGLNCYSCPGAVAACPLGALQNAMASAGHRAGWYVLGILLLYGVILGRTVCGWLCPMGLIQELIHKIPTPKLKKSLFTQALSWLKYGILAAFVLVIPLIYGLREDIPLPAFCKYICPAGTLEGSVGLLANPANDSMFGMLGTLFTNKLVILVAVGLACAFCYRAFCRFLCPLGALYGLFNRFNIVGVKVDASRCNGCGACVGVCGMDVRRVGDHECIQCGGCLDACARGAISVRAGGVTLRGIATGNGSARPRRRLAGIAWAVALAALAIALVWFNALDPSLRRDDGATALEQAEPDAAPLGWEVGQTLPDFSIERLDGGVFELSQTRGRVTFINLWATWCAPCVRELPFFDELQEKHGEDVAVIAVHSPLVTDDPAAFVADKGWSMPMAVDADETVWAAVNGSSALPQTIVLNRRGEVVYNRQGSVTSETLEALFETAKQ